MRRFAEGVAKAGARGIDVVWSVANAFMRAHAADDQDAWHKDLPWMFPSPNAPYLFNENKAPKIAVKLISDIIVQRHTDAQ